ncbi:FecR domain-containing protein [Pedobacter antarcticus]|uniref:FecR domain-containing protein n=1 Tax=Pedobacter antarcticus TaxID=34086 RepID=UPI00292E1AAD|nr:FecR domain-containing protein [Pedobacter antarcticus]
MNAEGKDYYPLFKKYLDQTASEAEILEFMRFVSDPVNELLIHHYLVAIQDEQDPGEGLDRIHQEEILQQIFSSDRGTTGPRKTIKFKSLIIGIAALLLLAGGYLSLVNVPSGKQTSYKQYTGTVKPGTDQATLTVENGKIITLTELPEGEFIRNHNLKIRKQQGGLLVYVPVNAKQPDSRRSAIHTLKTPAGGKFQLRLPDGTRVWLNASTTFSFPSSFAPGEPRKVRLDGEAYFEVASSIGKSGKVPFIVSTKNQDVEVLGTHFNIQAYAENDKTLTTLAEGSIRIHHQDQSSRKIRPGEQTAVGTARQQIEIHQVDTSMALAWKNGLFKFKNAGIRQVMQEFSRWYAIDVAYEGEIPDLKFNGEVYRDMNATQALRLLSMASINFRVVQSVSNPEIKRIIITGSK